MRSRLLFPLVALLAAVTFVVAACGSDDSSGNQGGSASGGTISGAGATFPQPVYDE